ncbi:integrase family protein [Pseudohalocynthiibacter sp. F2068]|jgi:integrase|uniref:tyrosine-type recombinase/integrase n=1 Tax=Pseudohalocynthiibacter sp. F2068 TaxID=2926418 RepID=UPI001FF367A8|nr:integrase family protein [Pseudohalocynthiibacter sp. F2068]MCK0104443.1 integrase family protein [Pseudohalocynthiibacter sp. F2068]
MPKLTEHLAKRLPQSKAGTDKHWDSEIRGLVLFVGKRSKTWYFQKDVGGKTQRILIGRYPMISAQIARQTAMGLALDMGRGAGKVAQIGAPRLEAAMEAYLVRPKLRSELHKQGMRQQFELHLKDWLRLPLDEITKQMVVERHRSLSDRPSAANHVLKYFRTVWNHARRTHDLPESPTMAIEWCDETPEGRIIENLREWRSTVDRLENPLHRVFYELSLFTGLRKTEVLTLRWDQVFEDRIHLPMTKNGRSFDLPILQVHHEILAPLKNLSRTWVFPSPKSASGRVHAPQRLKWSPHAHRRTFATVAMETGVLEDVVGRLLNHTPLSITGQRYVKPSLDALRPSMEVVCGELIRRVDLKA